MNESLHPFFSEIKKYPKLVNSINFDMFSLPKPYHGKNKTKAILLGADPTNNGIKTDKGLKVLETVFALNSKYEDYFFRPQKYNLSQLDISKDDLFIQNLCRNYFVDQTSKNKQWKVVAQLWLKYLKEELENFDKEIPVVCSAEKILKVLIPKDISADIFYKNPNEYLPLWSDTIERYIYPLYRCPRYYLSVQPVYKNFLLSKLK